MRRFLKTLLLLAAPVSVLGDEPQATEALSFTVELAKTVFAADQIFQVVATVRNVSDHPVIIHLNPVSFAAFHVELVGEDGISVPRHVDRTGMYAASGPHDFTQLDPGEAARLAVDAKLLDRPVDVCGIGGDLCETLEGPIVGYGAVYLPVKHQGQYVLKAVYSLSEQRALDYESRFGFRDVWFGRIKSNGVAITIE